jgi:VanZ family protein
MVKKNIFSIFVALIIIYLSLASSEKFEKVSFYNIPFADRIVHFGMYFGFMSVIIFENRKNIRSTRHLCLIALVPLFYGILMEILQSTLTTTRNGNFFDVIFNSAGILVSIILWLCIKHFIKETIR